jgi:hypothetical protein
MPNSHDLHANRASENYYAVENAKWKFKEWPPSYDDDDSGEFIVCCGDTDFETDIATFRGMLWWPKGGDMMHSFRVLNPLPSKDGKPSLCGTDEVAITYPANRKNWPDMVFLCTLLEADPVAKDSAANLAEWATYGALNRADRLNYGTFFDDIAGAALALSANLLHEIFHVIRYAHS